MDRKYRKLLVIFVVWVLAVGCEDSQKSGSSGLIPRVPIDLTGTWNGTWTTDPGFTDEKNVRFSDPGFTDGLTLVLEQIAAAAGVSIRGEATFTNLPDVVVLPTGASQGTVNGVEVTGAILKVPENRNLEPSCDNTNMIVISADLDALGERMEGRFTATVFVECEEIDPPPLFPGAAKFRPKTRKRQGTISAIRQ